MSSEVLFLILAVCYWLFCFGMGVWGYKVTPKSEDFYVGGRTIGPLVMALALFATFNSSILLMSHPGEIYNIGLSYMAYMAPGALFAPSMILIFYQRVYTINKENNFFTPAQMFGEYFQNKNVRIVTALVALVMGIPYVALQLTAAGYVFFILTDGMIPETFGTFVMGGIVIVYVFLGGLKSTSITDSIQGILLTSALLIAAAYGAWAVGVNTGGGFLSAISELPSSLLLSPGPEGAFPWHAGATLLLSVGCGVVIGPLSLMWALSAKDDKVFRFSASLGYIFHIVTYVILVPIVGLSAKVLHPGIEVTDQIVPTLINDAPTILFALAGVGIFAAINSTADIYLHSSGSMVGLDLIPFITKNDKEPSPWHGRLAQLTIVIIGLILVFSYDQTLVYLGALAGGFGMQILPALFGCLFWPSLKGKGIVSGMIVGLFVTILTEFVWVHPFHIHSGLWGVICNFAVVFICSLISTEKISQESYDKFHGVLKRNFE